MAAEVETTEGELAQMQAEMAEKYKRRHDGSLRGFDEYWRQKITRALREAQNRKAGPAAGKDPFAPKGTGQDLLSVGASAPVGEGGKSPGFENSLDSLGAACQSLKQHGASWRWLIDLSRMATIELPFLDDLLAADRQLRAWGGHLVIENLNAAGLTPAFSDLFLRRCKERGIPVNLEAETAGAGA